jgi:DNA-binding XRE family transcriptional regulator
MLAWPDGERRPRSGAVSDAPDRPAEFSVYRFDPPGRVIAAGLSYDSRRSVHCSSNQGSAVSRPSPEHILIVVSLLTGIPLDALQSPSQLRKLGPTRAAAAHLLRAEAGLSVLQVAPLLARSPQTICEFSRNARLADQTSIIAELINRARQLLDVSMHNSAPTTTEPVPNRRPVRPPGNPRALPVPHLAQWRARAGLTRAQLAERSGIARRTLARLEHGRPARRGTILQLADTLLLAPSVLTGSMDLDPLTGKTFKRCKNCGALRPVRAFPALRTSTCDVVRVGPGEPESATTPTRRNVQRRSAAPSATVSSAGRPPRELARRVSRERAQ